MPHNVNILIFVSMYEERYTFAGYEKDPESGLSYAGARYYNPRYSIFTSTDPMWAKYPGLSPYNYCANNPVMLVDPDGREIEEGSIKEWNKQKTKITNVRDKLQNKKSLSSDQRNRLNSLNNTLNTMGDMESSTQIYALNNIGGESGNVTLNGTIVSINYTGQTANFVHEVTHGGQFECDGEGFSIASGKPITVDLYDEVAAFKAQFAYSPSSVYNLTSAERGGTSFSTITASWVQNITTTIGNKPYSIGGMANCGRIPLNVHSTYEDFLNSGKSGITRSIFPLTSNPYIYYKK